MQPEERTGPLAILGTVAKNNSETIRVSINEFKDHRYVDIRVGVAGFSGEFVPTKRGITIPLHRLPAIIDFLNSALTEARRLKLFNHETRDL